MEDTCNICCDPYTLVLRKPIECPGCVFKACSSCVKKYILDSINDPHCMNPECSINWSQGFMVENFTISWLNGPYKNYRGNKVLDREKSLLPDTQILIDGNKSRLKNQKKIVELQDKIKEIGNCKKLINKRIENLKDIKKKSLDEKKEYKELNADKKKLIQEIKDKKIEISVIMIESGHIKNNSIKTKFIKSCPTDNCSGFLNEDFHCSLCECDVCKKCDVIIENSHECLPGNIETFKLMKKECKPCPKCGSIIYKISGCDHMFCTQCNTSYSWKTGEMIKNNTNPHYYEWMRNNGDIHRTDELENNQCRGISLNMLTDHLHKNGNKYFNGNTLLYNNLLEFHRILNHIRFITINNRLYAHKENVDLRIKYLEKNINEKLFISNIMRRENINNRNAEIKLILQTFIDVVDDIFRDVMNITKFDFKTIKTIDKDIKKIMSFMFQGLNNIPQLYNCTLDFDHIVRLFHKIE